MTLSYAIDFALGKAVSLKDPDPVTLNVTNITGTTFQHKWVTLKLKYTFRD